MEFEEEQVQRANCVIQRADAGSVGILEGIQLVSSGNENHHKLVVSLVCTCFLVPLRSDMEVPSKLESLYYMDPQVVSPDCKRKHKLPLQAVL